MKAYCKIGFHTSVGGNPSGIGAHLRALDNADIPFFIKAADSMTGLFDAQEIIKKRRQAGKPDIPHTLVFRRSVDSAGRDYDVPDYTKEPEAAAAEHWQKHKKQLPTDLDPSLVWIETINELRKEVEWADWIGEFAYYNGQMAMADGYRFSAFGYSSGTPDEGAWDTDGMLRYLELCQQHPNSLSVALHEYSFKTDDIWFLRGDHIGRFEKLFATCDRHRIQRPKVLITEWGWTHNRVPPVATAMPDIAAVSAYYAKFPQLLGAAIWYLGPGFGGIANLAQKLIKPVTDYTLDTIFEVEPPVIDPAPPTPPMSPDEPETPTPEEPDERPATPPETPVATPPTAVDTPPPAPNARFVRDVTIPDDTRIEAGSTFIKKWLVRNTGNVPWGDGYRLVFSEGTNMAQKVVHKLPPTQPGANVQIGMQMTAPQQAGVHFADWRFQDDQGNLFGDIVYVRIVSTAPKSEPAGTNNGRWLADITIPDDSQVKAGTRFTKTWRVQNSGTRAWGDGYTLDFIGGVAMTDKLSVPLPNTAPGAETNISLDLTAPTTSGTHYGDWRMKDNHGNPFGELLYLRIQVPRQLENSLTQPMSQRDPRWANRRLGHTGSNKTVGEWGCLLTNFAMVANALGKETNPARLNHAMLGRGGYLNLYLTKWNALSNVYNDIIYGGKYSGRTPDLLQRIDASLAAKRPVTVHVDYTSSTPYSENDQHWVLIVGKDGNDYRINDPWLLPAQEASLRERYGLAGRPLRDCIREAIFYRLAEPAVVTTVESVPDSDSDPAAPAQLQTGMNINPDAPFSNPMDNDDLKGVDWVRFVFKLDARPPAERGNFKRAFAQYDSIVRSYNKIGTKSLIIINQETVWGKAPWQSGSSGDWDGYAKALAAAAKRIARRYKRYGEQVAYQIWNEGDKQNNPASVYLPPERFAPILKRVCRAIRQETAVAPIIFGGLATGPATSIDYLNRCKAALNGPWPVDAIGIHPYTRWGTFAPFDWGKQYGTLGEAFAQYRQALPDMPLWITEIGVADDREIGAQYYAEIGRYLKDVYKYVMSRHADLVPVLIWFAWSDNMRNAGIVDKNGRRKPHVYPAFRAVRNRELD